ncbi:MAG: DUF2062 domain-containing protein, partial [Gammaproteobacteria bacterium]|nr:DUF2062 domain-containing protein [Gammaproteobacteria bacterium]
MMKKIIRRYIPDREKLKNQKSLRIFGDLIHSPNLWHLNKKSVSNAMSVGLLCAWIPVPFQMILAAVGALMFRANLPVSVALVWITNPLTMPPMFYFAYLIGAWIVDVPVQHIEFELSYEWLKTGLLRIWEPFLLGCAVVGVASSILGHIGMRVAWRMFVVRGWKKRQERRAQKL